MIKLFGIPIIKKYFIEKILFVTYAPKAGVNLNKAIKKETLNKQIF